MKLRRNPDLNRSGMSLIEVLIATAVMGFIITALTSVIVSQQRETRMLTDKIATLDLQQLLVSALADGSICTYILTDSEQASNRSTNVINLADLASQKINLQRIPMKNNAAAPNLIRNGDPVSALSPNLRVESISLQHFAGTGDTFTADIVVTFESSGSRLLVPISTKTTLSTDPSSPANAKQIIACKNKAASGTRTWQNLNGSRSLNTAYTNDTDQDMEVSIQVYSGASGKRCSAAISVDGVSISYSFVNDSSGAAMCNAYATVPAGSRYSASSAGAGSLYGWRELK